MGFFGNSAEQKIARGAKSAMKGQFDRAIADFDEAIRLNPSADAFYNRANAYAELGQYDRAIADFDKAIRLNPKSAAAIEKRAAVIAIKSGRGGEQTGAIADVDEATRLNAKDAGTLADRANAYYTKGDYDRAMADYDALISLNPRDADALRNRGDAYRNKGNYDRAIADFDEVIRLNPKDAYAFNNRGIAYTKTGEYDRAIEDFDEAIRLNPNFTSAIEMSEMAIERKNELASGTEPHEPKLSSNEQANFVAPTKQSDAFDHEDIGYGSSLTEDEFLPENHKVPKNAQAAEFTDSPNLITEDDARNAGEEVIDLKRTAKEALGPELNALRKEPLSKVADNDAIEATPTTLITPEDEQFDSSDLIDLTKRAAKEDLGSELNAVRRELLSKFEGAEEDDARRTAFRPVDRELSEGEQEVREAIYKQAEALEATYRLVQSGRYRSLALTILEESVMWILKELKR